MEAAPVAQAMAPVTLAAVGARCDDAAKEVWQLAGKIAWVRVALEARLRSTATKLLTMPAYRPRRFDRFVEGAALRGIDPSDLALALAHRFFHDGTRMVRDPDDETGRAFIAQARAIVDPAAAEGASTVGHVTRPFSHRFMAWMEDEPEDPITPAHLVSALPPVLRFALAPTKRYYRDGTMTAAEVVAEVDRWCGARGVATPIDREVLPLAIPAPAPLAAWASRYLDVESSLGEPIELAVYLGAGDVALAGAELDVELAMSSLCALLGWRSDEAKRAGTYGPLRFPTSDRILNPRLAEAEQAVRGYRDAVRTVRVGKRPLAGKSLGFAERVGVALFKELVAIEVAMKKAEEAE
jgi:hypothetical protein